MSRRTQKEVGSGIARQSRSYESYDSSTVEGASELRAWFDQSERKRTREWGFHAETIAAVKAEMSRLTKPFAGLEPGTEAFLKTLTKYNEQFIERETEAWYIREIYKLASIVKRMVVESHSYWEAVSRAIMIGDLLTEFRLKFAWDEHALFGQKTRQNLSEGQSNRRRSSKESRIEAVDALIDAGHTLSNACRLAAPGQGVKPETLEKDYRRLKKESTSARMLSGLPDT